MSTLAQLARVMNSQMTGIRALAKESLISIAKEPVLQRAMDELPDASAQNGKGFRQHFWRGVRVAAARLDYQIDVSLRASGDAVEFMLVEVGGALAQVPIESVYVELKAAVGVCNLRFLKRRYAGLPFELIARDRASSAFIRQRSELIESDWRFAHKLRNCALPGLSGLSRQGGTSQCPRCFSQLATLGHVMSLSKRSLPAHRRHNAVLMLLLCELIGSAATTEEAKSRLLAELNGLSISRARTVSIDSELEGRETGFGQRPDIVIKDSHAMCAQVIDVTIVYEGRPNSFNVARNYKESKYEKLARALRESGFRTTVEAFIVGALGAWDPGNERGLRAAEVRKRQRKRLALNCVAHAEVGPIRVLRMAKRGQVPERA